MSMEEEEFSPYAAFSSGCDIHGEDFLRECTMCGLEFCSACFPQSNLCSDCAAQGDIDIEEEAPTAEEKELLLLDGIIEDETEGQAGEAPLPPPAKKVAPPPKVKEKAQAPPPVAKAPAKPAPKAKAKAKARKPAKKPPKAKAKAKKSTKLPPQAKTKPKAKAKAKSKPKAKAKPKGKAKSAPGKRKR